MRSPLTKLDYAGNVHLRDGEIVDEVQYKVWCDACVKYVTREESGGLVNDAPLQQANLYRERHLARHLKALAEEILEAVG